MQHSIIDENKMSVNTKTAFFNLKKRIWRNQFRRNDVQHVRAATNAKKTWISEKDDQFYNFLVVAHSQGRILLLGTYDAGLAS